ncbi:ZYRO0C01584p [Zygosaccharomyces rouxii]|uniref:ZYRO0C01584p n=1 Tax=Zygosaccharomyces rouxii (strain ATCC 2623 / CBS 732 / NBRC 1130 / NCYC 568 / NRRL Y-229) TaxID=559307 RepID=C5DSN1_ZYGRC|nr:uncharacterized protein ZYRO0C01584g [Zygosaccharomyces rouxii]KAH9202017.1 Securin sister-chromatid separation inhibitor [Zygosaccharomyces rouxii]CAR26792.1 ZYRO0C01584p [Zygosaccharomyces rouxii]
MVGKVQDNKENNVVLDPGENGSLALPQTPIHLLKRSQPNVLKPEENTPVKKSRSVSPVRGQRRLPLASKDHNKSSAAGPVKKRQPTLQGELLSNPRKLQKYGSVLGYTDLPRTKSLVLKDGDDEDDDEEEENSELQKKLQDAMNRREDSNEGLGGLAKLVRDTKDDIEYAPHRLPPLEYAPDGHTRWEDEDIVKLKKVDLRIRDDQDDHEDNEPQENDDGLLPLMSIESNNEDSNENEADEILPKNHRIHPFPKLRVFDEDQVENIYNGEGLNAEELEDLLA